jgi:uncharacterized protein
MTIFKQKIISLTVMVVLFITSSCQRGNQIEKETTNSVLSNTITIGTIDTVDSKILGEKRVVYVHVPDSVPGGGWATNKLGFPVLYILDAEVNFHSVVGILHSLSRDEWNTICPRMIVVGVQNTNRTRDFSPTAVKSANGLSEEALNSSGGAEKFSAFLENELFPYIEHKYATVPFRLLVGHSLGGLFSLHTLTNHSNLFNAVIASDPSVYWDNNLVIKQLSKKLRGNELNHKSVFITTSQHWIRKPNSDTSHLYDGARAAYKLLDSLNTIKCKLHWGYQHFPAENHQTVPHIAIYEGLRFIFKHHELPTLYGFESEDFDPYAVVTKNYDTLYERLGYKFIPPEVPLYFKIQNLLNQNKLDKVFPLIKIMHDNYPDLCSSWAMGDYYRRKGDNILALQYFEESYNYFPDESVKQDIESLRQK